MKSAPALAGRRPFLTARWEQLVLLNYTCPRELLDPLVPVGTELDRWRSEYVVSLVGFMFRDTRVLGVPIPFHRTFEEVNLRFYVRRIVDGKVRRAVVFIRELVPRRAIAAVARWAYNEPYLAVPMTHSVELDVATGGRAEYSWMFRREQYRLFATCAGEASPLVPGSEAEYITQHYWGYTAQRDGSTLEYHVDHPPWLVWETDACGFKGGGDLLYGPEFGHILASTPRSAHVAAGSHVAVYSGRPIAPA